MSIQEILKAHTGRTFDSDGMYVCQCGHYIGTNKGKADRHRAHVAEVLEQHMQEREAEAWDRLVGYAPFTAFERVRLRCENPFREEPSDD